MGIFLVVMVLIQILFMGCMVVVGAIWLINYTTTNIPTDTPEQAEQPNNPTE